jgi:hypothetical protein
MALCTHLEDYANQFRLAEGAYRECVRLTDAVLAEGPGAGRAKLLGESLADWRAKDARLRDLLLELVKAGRVRVPRRLLAAGAHRHAGGQQGTMICATCRRALPRLRYSEWQFAHNGTVTFRGRELPAGQAATV